jgi:hypothetical protein
LVQRKIEWRDRLLGGAVEHTVQLDLRLTDERTRVDDGLLIVREL